MGEGRCNVATATLLPLPCGQRVGVRGGRAALSCCADYRFKHTFEVLQYIMVPETKNKVPHRFESLGSSIIASILVVLSSIDFNDEVSFLTAKIDDEVGYRHLPPELQSMQAPVA